MPASFPDNKALSPEDAECFIAAELARRGYAVFDAYAGIVRVSLMGIRNGVRIYVRTVQKLDDGNAKRELAAFRYAPDFFPKHIVSLEPISLTADMCGFRFRELGEFLNSKDYRRIDMSCGCFFMIAVAGLCNYFLNSGNKKNLLVYVSQF